MIRVRLSMVLPEVGVSDVTNWRNQEVVHPAQPPVWFMVALQEVGSPGEIWYHVQFATRSALKNRSDRGRFIGFILDPMDFTSVEPLISEFLDGIAGETWHDVELQLATRMIPMDR